MIHSNSSLVTNGESVLNQLSAANDTYEEETVEESKCVAQGGSKEKMKVTCICTPYSDFKDIYYYHRRTGHSPRVHYDI